MAGGVLEDYVHKYVRRIRHADMSNGLAGSLCDAYDGVVPNFETFTKRMVPLTKAPYVTIQKRGIMSLNKSAWVALGSPEAIEFLYDPEEQIIALKGVDPNVEHAYPIRGTKTDGPWIVSGTAFTRYFKIATDVSRRYTPYVDGDLLCIDLKMGGTEVTSNRVRNGQTTAEAVADNLGESSPGVSSPV
jgi:hypothetical protein